MSRRGPSPTGGAVGADSAWSPRGISPGRWAQTAALLYGLPGERRRIGTPPGRSATSRVPESRVSSGSTVRSPARRTAADHVVVEPHCSSAALAGWSVVPIRSSNSPLPGHGRSPDARAARCAGQIPVGRVYSQGTRPGEPGAAMILGHVDSKSGPAVFFRAGCAPGPGRSVIGATHPARPPKGSRVTQRERRSAPPRPRSR